MLRIFKQTKNGAARSWPVIACVLIVAWPVPVAPAAPVDQNISISIDKLIRDLADESYTVRENASNQLWEIGHSALPRLKRLQRSEDPEQAIRARELVRKIEMGLSPDSDPELLSIVKNYRNAQPSAKAEMLTKLQNKRAWKLMLKLGREETNEELRKEFQDSLQRVAIYAARTKISHGDDDGALELLELAPRTRKSLLALAHFHRVKGTIDEQLRKTRGKSGDEVGQWRLALHRASGNIKAALQEIDADENPKLAAALAAFDGDPLPWLRLHMQNHDDPNKPSLSSGSTKLYARLAMDRWMGREMAPADFAELVKMPEDRMPHYRSTGRNAMFMLGEHDLAEAALINDAPMWAALYLLTMERIDEALQLLGQSADEPCTQEWVAERVRKLDEESLDDFEVDLQDTHELFLMAGFLESRGLHELAYQCFREPVLEYAQTEKDDFPKFITRLFNSGLIAAPRLAIRLYADWAQDNEARWNLLIDTLWADRHEKNKLFRELWLLLDKLNTDLSLAKRLELLLIITRVLPDEKEQRKDWIDLAWEHSQGLEAQEREDLQQQLIDLAFRTNDAELSQKMWAHIPKKSGSNYFWRFEISHLTAREEWNEACEILLEQVELVKNKEGSSINPAFHAYAACALRKAGRFKEAEHHDYMVDLLFLGDDLYAEQIGDAYAFGHDIARRNIWWERFAHSISPDSSDFVETITSYANSMLLMPEKWPLVASLHEVASCEQFVYNPYQLEAPMLGMHYRLKSDTYRALSRMKSDRSASLKLLADSHKKHMTDGVLADFFFPVLRKAGLYAQHDQMFQQSWMFFTNVLAQFPDSANTHNTASWFASRAQREIDAAISYQDRALELFPDQPAFLDTMAEIYFAKGERNEALKWSRKAIMLAPTDTVLRLNYEHFHIDAMPD